MDLNDDDNTSALCTSEEDTSSDGEQLSDQDLDLDDKNDLESSEKQSDKSELENHQFDESSSIINKVKAQIYQRYQERHGKQLYIRFPHKVPETQEALDKMVKELTPLAIKSHKPRQKHVRFCLVDFATKEDRDATLNTLKKSIKKGDLKKFAASIPRTESLKFVQELAERKIKSIENKKAKLRMKRASKKALKENKFTSTVVVLNLPRTASSLEVRELFPNAVDMNIKHGKGKMRRDTSFAAVTFPTTLDARNAVKKKLFMGGNHLIIKFDNKNLKKKTESKNEISKQSEPTTERLVTLY